MEEKVQKIDIVVPWVDGNDPLWQQEKNMYSTQKGDQSNIRFREWDVMRYWFRGIDKYAKWVRKVHFITWGHVPDWLNCECEKINIVNHKDYIPHEYLPTFSSHTIELNMHRIQGLSDKFIYFNDDTFLINPTTEDDFFSDDLPIDIAGLHPGYATVKAADFDHILLNDAEFYVRNFNAREVLKRDRKKWLRMSYGKQNIKTLAMLMFSEFPDIIIHHQPQSFLKKTLQEVWEQESELLDATCQNKFRTRNDVNQYIFRYWQLGHGCFQPYNVFKRGVSVSVGIDPVDYDKCILHSKYKILVLNDNGDKVDFETEKKHMQMAFEAKFPEKSIFEK